MSKRLRVRLLWLLVPVSAIVLAVGVSSIVLLSIGESPIAAFRSMFRYGTQGNSVASMINRAVPLFVAGLAVAIGFKMNLFNIGVEGQYRIAALLSAAAGAAVTLPAPLHIAFIMLVAMIAGAGWASIAGVLKVKRGVHEVVSTIMLNSIATGLGAYLLANYLRKPARRAASCCSRRSPIPPSGQLARAHPDRRRGPPLVPAHRHRARGLRVRAHLADPVRVRPARDAGSTPTRRAPPAWTRTG